MTPLAAAFLVYSVQVAAVVAVAAVAARWLRNGLPSARLAYWRVVGLLCLALPLLAPAGGPLPGASATLAWSEVPVAGGAVEAAEPLLDRFAPALVWIYASGVAVRLAWLLAGGIGLRRIRRRAAPAALDATIEGLRRSIAPRAEFRWSGEVGQPVACGLLRPFVLLPHRFAALCADAQRAVAHHELLHVRRRDWAWIVVEEHLRAAFWFHPAAWWVLEQVQLSREQVIDRAVASSGPSKRPYMNALLAFADGGRLAAPSVAFLRHRHLEARLRELSKEVRMSRNRLILSMAALLLATGAAAAGAARALPLDVPALSLQAASSSHFEIRLAENAPGDGLVPAAGAGRAPLYLHPGAIATADDVVAADVATADGSQFTLAIRFSDSASTRVQRATREHIGKPVAVLLDGEVVSAPILRAPIGSSAMMTGFLTEAYARQIAERLSPDRSAAARRKPVDSQAFGIVPPTVVRKVDPRYTRSAMDAKIEGTVILEAVVDVDGSVRDAVVTKSLDAVHGLDEQAVEAAREWQFRPGTAAGRPVAVKVTLEMRFTLK